MPFSGMRCPVAFVRTDFSEESISSIIRVKIINEVGTTLTITAIAEVCYPYCRLAVPVLTVVTEQVVTLCL
jgi:hypothetical protein